MREGPPAIGRIPPPSFLSAAKPEEKAARNSDSFRSFRQAPPRPSSLREPRGICTGEPIGARPRAFRSGAAARAFSHRWRSSLAPKWRTARRTSDTRLNGALLAQFPPAPAPGRAGTVREKSDIVLTGRLASCYCFSELNSKPASASRRARPRDARDSARNEIEVKPLKTNDPAKWPVSHA